MTLDINKKLKHYEALLRRWKKFGEDTHYDSWGRMTTVVDKPDFVALKEETQYALEKKR